MIVIGLFVSLLLDGIPIVISFLKCLITIHSSNRLHDRIPHFFIHPKLVIITTRNSVPIAKWLV